MNISRHALKKINIPKRTLFTPINNYERETFSLVPLAYVITITSILWGFESYNNKKLVYNSYANVVNDIYIDCLKLNSKNNCLEFKNCLYSYFEKNKKLDKTFKINFEAKKIENSSKIPPFIYIIDDENDN